MKDNALAVANYFIELAQKENRPITLLGLIKRVYIAHGFSLAIFHKSLLDPRFDKVEAWKYGPVIPSVYHSFKQFKANPITEKTVVMTWDEHKMEPCFHTSELRDDDAKKIVKMVWDRYKGYSDSRMVSITHQKGTPWDRCYVEGCNEVISDDITEMFYKALVKVIVSESGKA
ncbi:Panacea domain-containing protein [uncultured Alistipes sp.]|uniref:Panacea domain-containing protein n=1 Tax=uncultured Alistipes sp. TaxID=538949 RepID=UPI002620932F|nr:type II toxin-antitoxin system antitoxin SocA domain-containing protein [uncultured Alistipes sp.]